MPDTYGFETKDDRLEARRRQWQAEHAALAARSALFQDIQGAIRDVLEHYVRAYELDAHAPVAIAAHGTECAIGSLGAPWGSRRLRVAVLEGPGADAPGLLGIQDLTTGRLPSKEAVRQLGSALHQATGLPVALLNPATEDGQPFLSRWPEGPGDAEPDDEPNIGPPV